MKEQVYKSTFYFWILSFATDFGKPPISTPSVKRKKLQTFPKNFLRIKNEKSPNSLGRGKDTMWHFD